MTFTIYFIDANWDLVSYCLQTHYLPRDHTGTNIVEVLEESIQQWEFKADKLVGITTDSDLNIKVGCNLLNWTRLSSLAILLPPLPPPTHIQWVVRHQAWATVIRFKQTLHAH